MLNDIIGATLSGAGAAVVVSTAQTELATLADIASRP
jgi:hypothetical protein